MTVSRPLSLFVEYLDVKCFRHDDGQESRDSGEQQRLEKSTVFVWCAKSHENSFRRLRLNVVRQLIVTF